MSFRDGYFRAGPVARWAGEGDEALKGGGVGPGRLCGLGVCAHRFAPVFSYEGVLKVATSGVSLTGIPSR